MRSHTSETDIVIAHITRAPSDSTESSSQAARVESKSSFRRHRVRALLTLRQREALRLKGADGREDNRIKCETLHVSG